MPLSRKKWVLASAGNRAEFDSSWFTRLNLRRSTSRTAGRTTMFTSSFDSTNYSTCRTNFREVRSAVEDVPRVRPGGGGFAGALGQASLCCGGHHPSRALSARVDGLCGLLGFVP